jgi:histone deacetylase 11
MKYKVHLLLFLSFLAIVAKEKITIYYHPAYNIVPPFIFRPVLRHAFDGEKYQKVHQALLSDTVVAQSIMFKQPSGIIAETDLLYVHSKKYVDSLQNISTIAHVVEMSPLLFFEAFPNPLYRWISGKFQNMILVPAKWATQGTVEAALEAITDQKSVINLGGGFHHAKPNNGEGFCFFADIPLACKKIWDIKPNAKILVIDLDNHQGNGVATYREIDQTYFDNMFIFDMYAAQGYPMDKHNRAKYINFNNALEPAISSENYLKILKQNLEVVLDTYSFDLIIYNAGTDIFQEDPLGSMQVTKEGIIERDAFVFSLAKKHSIPVCMVLSGGYTLKSADIITESLKNIITKKLF